MRHGSIVVLGFLMAAAGVAQATTTPEEVAAARADCKAHRLRVEQRQSEYSVVDGSLEDDYKAWERACAYAEALMAEAGMEKPSAVPHEPAPPPEIRITERKPGPRAQRPQPANEPAVGGTPARRPDQ
jgi:hypothetical protein